jgi:glycyl-tRNA synthetase
MPFAAAQIGLGFRNEIAPRNGLLRVREFCMAEIEHFVNPDDKTHPKFNRVANKELVLFPADAQLGSGRTVVMTAGEAVEKKVINNETLAYFMTRTQLWLEKIGVDPKRMRFRQHLKSEMAHYAADCWDMEIHLSYGWIECVGHADRACYDLDQHAKKSGVPMVAAVRLPAPILVDKMIAEPNKKLLGPRFKLDQKTVINALEALEGNELKEFKATIEEHGTAPLAGFDVTSDLVTFKTEKKMIVETKYTPSVIEPSYGIGRILYAVLEHSFSQRSGDENRCVMSFKPCVAPMKIGIYRLINHPPFDSIISRLRDSLQAANIVSRVDSSSGSVGRRYSRADELGIPFGATVDFQTLLDDTVTLRDRNTMAQVRVPLSRLNGLLQQLIAETISWDLVMARYPIVHAGGEEEEEEEEGVKKASVVATVVEADVPATIVENTHRGMFSRPNPLLSGIATSLILPLSPSPPVIVTAVTDLNSSKSPVAPLIPARSTSLPPIMTMTYPGISLHKTKSFSVYKM